MMRRVDSDFSRLWNLSNSLLGLAASAGGSYHWIPDHKVLEVTGGWLITLLERHGWAAAITLGDVVLYIDDRMRTTLRAHELIHVRQGRTWGPLFLPLYMLESLWQWARTGDGYHNNRFEVEAYGPHGRN